MKKGTKKGLPELEALFENYSRTLLVEYVPAARVHRLILQVTDTVRLDVTVKEQGMLDVHAPVVCPLLIRVVDSARSHEPAVVERARVQD